MNDLDAIEARAEGHDGEFRAEVRHAQAIEDRHYLLDLVRRQEELLTAVLDLANVSGRRGWRINADDIRKTLGAEL